MMVVEKLNRNENKMKKVVDVSDNGLLALTLRRHSIGAVKEVRR